MIIALNNTNFKILMETLEKYKLNEAVSGSERIKIEPFTYSYIIRLKEETVVITSNSRDIDVFFDKIHTISEIKDREQISGPNLCLKEIIEKEFHIKLLED
ncbi:MAG: hypothetical protein ACRCY7_07640 [Cetobacterium sp.]|uniref:hypothetical protein n=1 Tax=Cetobacterium sp. TaxID=2071632 RepID=UPI003F33D43E